MIKKFRFKHECRVESYRGRSSCTKYFFPCSDFLQERCIQPRSIPISSRLKGSYIGATRQYDVVNFRHFPFLKRASEYLHRRDADMSRPSTASVPRSVLISVRRPLFLGVSFHQPYNFFSIYVIWKLCSNGADCRI